MKSTLAEKKINGKSKQLYFTKKPIITIKMSNEYIFFYLEAIYEIKVSFKNITILYIENMKISEQNRKKHEVMAQ